MCKPWLLYKLILLHFSIEFSKISHCWTQIHTYCRISNNSYTLLIHIRTPIFWVKMLIFVLEFICICKNETIIFNVRTAKSQARWHVIKTYDDMTFQTSRNVNEFVLCVLIVQSCTKAKILGTVHVLPLSRSSITKPSKTSSKCCRACHSSLLLTFSLSGLVRLILCAKGS